MNIKVKTPFSSTKFKYLLNESFFETINSEHSAYILGLMQTDGCVYLPKRSQAKVTLKLASHDSELVTQVSMILFGQDFTKTYHSPSMVKKGQPSTEITFYSNKMSEDLEKLGVTPAKSKTLQMSQHLQDVLLGDSLLASHWFRGIIDGDGSIVLSNGRPSIELYGSSPTFLMQVAEVVLTHTGVLMNEHKKHNIVDGLRKGGISDTKTIINWMYDSSTIWCTRKKQVAERILEK